MCPVCRDEGRALRELLAGLDALAPSMPAPPAVRARLMDRIRSESRTREVSAPFESVQIWKRWTDRGGPSEDGFFLRRSDEGEWASAGVAGVAVRELFVDTANDRVTMLVRMAPGSSYPSHRHANVEECLVLEGVLNVGDLRLRAGDYQRAASGSAHVVQSTDSGCLLFIVSSLHDELLPGPRT